MAQGRGSWLAYAGFLVNGMGTVLVGPLLPRLEATWGLGDGEGGALLAALFLGSSVGTMLVLRDRRRAMVTGGACAWAGLSGIALLLHYSSKMVYVEALACAALLVYGFGLGQGDYDAESDGWRSRGGGRRDWRLGMRCGAWGRSCLPRWWLRGGGVGR